MIDAPCKECICLSMCRNRVREYVALNCSIMVEYIMFDKKNMKKRYVEIREILNSNAFGVNVALITYQQTK